jgi:hypothetical protein
MLSVVPFKDEYVSKLIFMHGLKPSRTNILDICQRLMKMAECMEDEGLPCPKGETTNGITLKNQIDLSSGSKGYNKHKWGQGKPRPPSNKEKSVGKHNKDFANPPYEHRKIRLNAPCVFVFPPKRIKLHDEIHHLTQLFQKYMLNFK